MAEEEVTAELEAVEAVYGDDFHLIEAYPPHLHVHLKPRTAEVFSQQFVEATIGMRAGPQYPEEPPEIIIIDSKGLDEQRQKHLLTSIRGKASELVSCSMIVALCEEAVERLSSMNHPEGDCPLCLHPLLDEDAVDCIIRWWKWNQVESEKENKSSSSSSSSRITQHQQGMRKSMEENMGKCPVCRKIFHAKDIEHVLDLVGTGDHLDTNGNEIDEDVLHSEPEKIRRQKFEAILKLQQENSGLIEPKKDEVLLPGMFLPPRPVVSPSTESDAIPIESRKRDPAANSHVNPGSSFNRPGPRKNSNSNARKHRAQNSGKQARNWIKKDEVSKS
ncbi:hypothetical protein CASFOL_041743 [Castilleja foliolosa]|uniref:RWD domain-containing protein n=1 Tax=Castilleja foliolosa TaxID=1961234 RepID=A0ABD3B952_9LAMI